MEIEQHTGAKSSTSMDWQVQPMIILARPSLSTVFLILRHKIHGEQRLQLQIQLQVAALGKTQTPSGTNTLHLLMVSCMLIPPVVITIQLSRYGLVQSVI